MKAVWLQVLFRLALPVPGSRRQGRLRGGLRLLLRRRAEEDRQRDRRQNGGAQRHQKQTVEIRHAVVREFGLLQPRTKRIGRQRANPQDHYVEQALRAGPHVFWEILIHKNIDGGEKERVADAMQHLDDDDRGRARQERVHRVAPRTNMVRISAIWPTLIAGMIQLPATPTPPALTSLPRKLPVQLK